MWLVGVVDNTSAFLSGGFLMPHPGRSTHYTNKNHWERLHSPTLVMCKVTLDKSVCKCNIRRTEQKPRSSMKKLFL